MKILRTILWVLGAIGFLIFAIYNWQPVELTLWQNLVLETKVPVLALVSFLVGFLPMWAVHRSVAWGQSRRIRTLETSLKTAAAPRPVPTDTAPVIAMETTGDRSVDNHGKTGGVVKDPFASPDTAGHSAEGGAK